MKKKKKNFQNSTSDIQKEYDVIFEEYKKNEKVFRECQDKYHQLNLSMKINEEMIKRCESEQQYNLKPDKRLNESYKSYNDYYHEIINAETRLLGDLREQQQKTKEAYEDNDLQIKLYSDMKGILSIKLSNLQGKK